MNKTNLITFALLIAILAAVIITAVIPVAFATPSKGFITDHYFEYVKSPGITWTDARTAAQNSTYNGVTGHLATMANHLENFDVVSLLPDDANVWVGLADNNAEGQYAWVTGERFNFSNWNTDQPSAGPDEDYVKLTYFNFDHKWNVTVNDDPSITGYVVEYLPPPPEPVQNPENGHYYQHISTNGFSWAEAKAAAESRKFNDINGHLVTITSQSENDFVNDIVTPLSPFTFISRWIGLTDEVTEGQHKWVTGEPFDYSNWSSSSSSGVDDDYGLISTSQTASNTITTSWTTSENHTPAAIGYITEYSQQQPTVNIYTGKYYQYISAPGISWTDADIMANKLTFYGARGHLATIDDQAENDFISGLISELYTVWIGLSDADSHGDYKWVDGDPLQYTNWSVGEPENTDDIDYGILFGTNEKWGVTNNDDTDIDGFVVEYDLFVYNPENSHYYQYVLADGISWTDAKAAAESRTHNGHSGHLVTITSQSENNFVAKIAPYNSRSWIGLADHTLEGIHNWVTNEPTIYYSNWDVNQPDDHNGNEDYVEFMKNNKKWNDLPNDGNGLITGYIIEYTNLSIDSDGDAIPDYHDNCPDIFNQHQEDIDGDGIGDVCEVENVFIAQFDNDQTGKTYIISQWNGIPWVDAHMEAKSFTNQHINTRLATIENQSVNDQIAEHIPDGAHIWIGLHDSLSDGIFEWVSGHEFNYQSWDVNEPSNSLSKDFVVMDSDGKWSIQTGIDDSVFGYVLEIDYTS